MMMKHGGNHNWHYANCLFRVVKGTHSDANLLQDNGDDDDGSKKNDDNCFDDDDYNDDYFKRHCKALKNGDGELRYFPKAKCVGVHKH